MMDGRCGWWIEEATAVLITLATQLTRQLSKVSPDTFQGNLFIFLLTEKFKVSMETLSYTISTIKISSLHCQVVMHNSPL